MVLRCLIADRTVLIGAWLARVAIPGVKAGSEEDDA